MKYVFGPVPSRRLGQSLGIDPIPLKTCNWNCVYCQLGRSVPMTNERRAYFPADGILAEVKAVLQEEPPPAADWITFVGSGEPTLNSELGRLIRQVKQMTDIPVAVCTNGALLYLPEVRHDLLAADAVMPTVAAGTEFVFRQIHRPLYGLTLARLVEGLIAFRAEYRGQLWPEVMLVRGLNDSEEALQDIAAVLARIGPDRVDISLPSRPPAESWVLPPDEEGLMRALAILGRSAQVIHPDYGSFDLSAGDSVFDAVLDIITRHPMSQADLEQTLTRWAPEEVDQLQVDLLAGGQAQVVERHGLRFWTAGPGHFPDEASSLAVSPERLASRRPASHPGEKPADN